MFANLAYSIFTFLWQSTRCTIEKIENFQMISAVNSCLILKITILWFSLSRFPVFSLSRFPAFSIFRHRNRPQLKLKKIQKIYEQKFWYNSISIINYKKTNCLLRLKHNFWQEMLLQSLSHSGKYTTVIN